MGKTRMLSTLSSLRNELGLGTPWQSPLYPLEFDFESHQTIVRVKDGALLLGDHLGRIRGDLGCRDLITRKGK
jgi:hypothetical protein